MPQAKGVSHGPRTPPDLRQSGRRARPHDRGAARDRLRAAHRSRSSRDAARGRRPSASSRRSSCSSTATARDAAGSCSSTSPAAGPSAPPRRRRPRARGCCERPAERGLSQAALETLAVVAYLGPCSRPEIARIRGVNVDGVVAGLVERGLIAEGGREGEFGAVRYRTTPLFERVFGLESLAALPRVDDLGADVTEIRARLEAVAEKRPA